MTLPELIYVVSSDNISKPNYKYICDLYAADGITRLARIKRIPQPDDCGMFDLHRILENYVSSDIDVCTVGFAINDKSYYGYVVKIGEEYGVDNAIGPDQYLSLVVDEKRYVFNAVFDFPEFVNYKETDVVLNNDLGNSPRTQNIMNGTRGWLHFISDSPIEKAVILCYGSDGS